MLSKLKVFLILEEVIKKEKLNGNTPYNLMKEKTEEKNIKKLGFLSHKRYYS